MMNKKAVAMFIEIIGGTVAAVGILLVIVVIVNSGSSSMIDGVNKQSLDSLVSGVGKTINTQISGGENTINIWNLNSYSSYVYSLVLIPYGTANKIYNEFRAQNDVSFVEKLDLTSINEIKKCGIDSNEACMCLFKIQYISGCAPDNNIITLNMAGPPYFEASAGNLFDQRVYGTTRLGQSFVARENARLDKIFVKIRPDDARNLQPLTVSLYESAKDSKGNYNYIPGTFVASKTLFETDAASNFGTVYPSPSGVTVSQGFYDYKWFEVDFSGAQLSKNTVYILVLGVSSNGAYNWESAHNNIPNPVLLPTDNGVDKGLIDSGAGTWKVQDQSGMGAPIFSFKIQYKLASNSKYGYELYKADEWAQYNFVDGIKKDDVSSAKVLTCVPLVNSGCMHVDAEGKTGPCIIHYKSEPVVWISSEKTNPLNFENIIVALKSYSSAMPNGMEYFGSFPDIDFTVLKSSEIVEGNMQARNEVFTALNPAVDASASKC